MADIAMRSEKFPFGVSGVRIGEIERQVPAGEPPPLPVNSALQVIGKPVPRQDARAKVTGAVRFTVDVTLPGLLHARILRSPLPHARVQAIDAAAAARYPGVRAVLVIASADAILRYVGEPIAAVAAATPAAADAALRPDPSRLRAAAVRGRSGYRTPAECAAGVSGGRAPLAGGCGDPRRGRSAADRQCARPGHARRRGDIEQGFAQAEVVVEAEYRTQTQTHCCMEPHAIVADWRADGVTVWMSTQSTAGVRRELANAFGLKLEPGKGEGRRHGRRVRFEVVARHLWPATRSRCRVRRAHRCGWCSIARRSNSTAAIGRRPGSICASALAAMAR